VAHPGRRDIGRQPGCLFHLARVLAPQGKADHSECPHRREFARFLLDKTINTNNRKRSETGVGNYRKDVLDGNWQHNGQTVVIAATGHLNDGQRRLAGIPRGDYIVTEMCVGVPRETRHSLDTASGGRLASASG
jgi:hypothetical protein